VAVVVPTRNRPVLLARCVAALRSQAGVESLEIVVVDDASDDRGAVDAAIAGTGARLVRTDGSGPGAARNAGLDQVRAPVVLFTDDDCIPEPSWAARLQAALSGGAVAVAGPTIVLGTAAALARASQLVTNALASETRRAAGRATFAPTSNLGLTTQLARATRFDEAFGRAGGEDRDLCARLAGAGHELRLVPDAIVLHEPPLTLRRFVLQHLRYGRGAFLFRAAHRSEPRLESPGFYRRLLAEGAACGVPEGVLVGVAQLATAAGFAAEATRAAARASRAAALLTA
jgi:glycosyltransferase involved in cell wall biosynthesis